MLSLDVLVTQAINQAAGKFAILDAFLIGVSAYAIPVLVAVVAVQWWRRGDRSTVRHTLVSAGFSFLLGLGINQIVLLVFDRVRPYDAGISHLLIAPSVDPSFPSDHATAAMAIAATFLLSRSLRTQGFALLAAAVLVAFSRVYIGIHYVGDVVGGALVGVLAAAIVQWAYKADSRLNQLLIKML